jgi:hypothetical protein
MIKKSFFMLTIVSGLSQIAFAQLTITTSGQIGIGTTTPTLNSKLHVTHNDYFSGGLGGVIATATMTGLGAYRHGLQGTANNGQTASYAVYGTSSSYAGYFNGNVTVTGTFSNPSDEKLKENVVSVKGTLDKLISLDSKSFTYKRTGEYEQMNLPAGTQSGFLAQELEAVFPELVSEELHPVEEVVNGERAEKEPITYKAINYIELIPILVQALKEQRAMIMGDRISSDDPAIGRFLMLSPTGDVLNLGTGWIASNGSLLTAGHCFTLPPVYPGGQSVCIDNLVFQYDHYVLEFNVPDSSESDGTLIFAAPDSQYVIDESSVIFCNTGVGTDWGVFRCFPNSNTNLLPVQAQNAFYRLTVDHTQQSAPTLRVTGYGLDECPTGSSKVANDVASSNHVSLPQTGSSVSNYTVGVPVSDTLWSETYSAACPNSFLAMALDSTLIPFVTGLNFQVEITTVTGRVYSNISDTVKAGNVFALPAVGDPVGLVINLPNVNDSFSYLIKIMGTPSVPGEDYPCNPIGLQTTTACQNVLTVLAGNDSVCAVQANPNSVEGPKELPAQFELKPNYPNPFNPTTTIEFSIPQASNVTLKIYNIRGEEVATLVSEKLPAGNYKRIWSAGELSSGVYFYRLQTETFVQTRRLLVMK